MVNVDKNNRHLIEPFEVAQMIEMAARNMDKSIIALYYITGIRVSEAFGIRKEDIWKDDKFLYIKILREKRSKKEIIPSPSVLSLSLETHFLPYIITQWEMTEPGDVIWNYSDNPNNARVYVFKMLKKLNPNIWPHLFRHTRAEFFRSKGLSERELMAWFGWIDARTPTHYTHPDENTIKKMGSMIE